MMLYIGIFVLCIGHLQDDGYRFHVLERHTQATLPDPLLCLWLEITKVLFIDSKHCITMRILFLIADLEVFLHSLHLFANVSLSLLR